MPKYKFTDPTYGRSLIFEADTQPSDDEIASAFEAEFQKDLKFSDATSNEQYMSDAKSNWKSETEKEWEDTDANLVEKEFEYWNTVENNLTLGGVEIASSFSNLPPKEAQRVLRRFDVYDRTNATGEGSRSGWEQFKGVGGAVLTDPLTWAGGGLGVQILKKVGGKAVLRGILEKVAFPAGVGGVWGGLADAEKQAMELELGARDEYDTEQTKTAAGVGAATGVSLPLAARTTGKVVGGMMKPVRAKDKIQKAILETLGGSKAAKEGALEEATDVLGTGDFASATTAVSDSLGGVLKDINKAFVDKYDDLGELAVNPNDVSLLWQKATQLGIKNGNIDMFIQQMKTGVNTPTKTLRLVRSELGTEAYKSSNGVGSNVGFDKVLQGLSKESRSLFSQAAKDAGKSKQASKLDMEYSNYMKMYDKKKFQDSAERASNASSLMSSILANPQKAPSKIAEHLKQMDELGALAGNKGFKGEQQKYLQMAMTEQLNKGSSSVLQNFMGSPSGMRALKAIYPDNAEHFSKWATILKNANKHGGAATFWGRIMVSSLAGAGGAAIGGGVTSGVIGGGVAFVTLSGALKSKAFKDMAMKVYAKKEIDQNALGRMGNWMKAKGATEGQVQAFKDYALGSITLTGTAQQAGVTVEDVKSGMEGIQRKASGAVGMLQGGQ